MALLSSTDRDLVAQRVMRYVSEKRTSLALTKADLQAAVAGIDGWIEANSGPFNSVLPASVQAALTDDQKDGLLSEVALRRFEV